MILSCPNCGTMIGIMAGEGMPVRCPACSKGFNVPFKPRIARKAKRRRRRPSRV